MRQVPNPPGRVAVTRLAKSAIRNPRVLCEANTYSKKVSFSRGMRVEIGNASMLYLSGTASVDETGQSVHVGDFAAQAGRVFVNLTALLESEGADWQDVVRTMCYLTDFRYYDQFNEIRNAFYTEQQLDPLPASTCIQAGLCRPELLVEIELIAMIPRDRSAGARIHSRTACERSS